MGGGRRRLKIECLNENKAIWIGKVSGRPGASAYIHVPATIRDHFYGEIVKVTIEKRREEEKGVEERI